MPVLRFGSKAEITIPDEEEVTTFGQNSNDPITDIAQAVRDALKSPDGYPDLASMTIPEDHVAIVVEPGLPHAADLVAGVVSELMAAKIEPECIVVVQSKLDTKYSHASPIIEIPESVRGLIQHVVHDPTDREMLSYLGPSAKETLIYANRQVADADVVIPLGMANHQEALGNLGVYGIIVPHFCDEETLNRFLLPKSSTSQKEIDARRGEAREIAWMLGIRLTVQLLMGDGDSVERVLVGDADVIEGHAQSACNASWRLPAPTRSDLVVAAISGGKSQQTWSNLARAIRAAVGLVEVDGTIAICTDISARPGSGLRRIVGAESVESAARSIQKDSSPDALAASELVNSLQKAKVYLFSGLDEQFVEDLGLGYISHPDEIVRLVGRHDSCAVLHNAQRVVV